MPVRRSGVWGQAAVYLGSTLAVASSITRMRFFLRMARARHTSCLWPTLKLEPDSASTVSILLGSSSTAALSWTWRDKTPVVLTRRSAVCHGVGNTRKPSSSTSSREFHRSSSLCWSKGSRFFLMVPVNSTGSCRSLVGTNRAWCEQLHYKTTKLKVSADLKGTQRYVTASVHYMYPPGHHLALPRYLRNDGHLLAQIMEADLRGQNPVYVDPALRLYQAEESRDQGALPCSRPPHNANLRNSEERNDLSHVHHTG